MPSLRLNNFFHHGAQQEASDQHFMDVFQIAFTPAYCDRLRERLISPAQSV
jgi:hypothetical protein